MKEMWFSRTYAKFCLAILGLAGFLVWWATTSYLTEAMIQAEGKALVVNTGSLFRAGRLAQSSTAAADPSHLVRVLDKRGKILFSSEMGEIGSVMATEGISDAAAGDFLARRSSLRVGDERTETLEAMGPASAGAGNDAVVAVTISTAPFANQFLAIKFGAAAFIVAALSLAFVIFTRLGTNRTKRLLSKNWELAGEKVELSDSLSTLEENYAEALRSIASAFDANTPCSAGHALRVSGYAVKIGKAMGLSPSSLKSIEDAALMHDLGKLWIPEDVRMKEEPLNAQDFAQIRLHPALAADLMAPLKVFAHATDIVLYHHERWDGSGYPNGLKGAAIPLEARILAVADAFDAMTSEHPYRNAMSLNDALEELYSEAGTHYDPRVVEAFINIFDDLIRETDGFHHASRYGVRVHSLSGNC